ncbi:hypothetical protein CIN01S_07_01430 [Chryseobacterium indologenes NBRC 14944]|nr:hypothetical protein CIN01S_07_01430 [Chryseobacterium indologenes NBRC 14944]
MLFAYTYKCYSSKDLNVSIAWIYSSMGKCQSLKTMKSDLKFVAEKSKIKTLNYEATLSHLEVMIFY